MKKLEVLKIEDVRKYLEDSLEYQKELLEYVRRKREGRELIESESRRLGRIFLLEDMLKELDQLEGGDDEDR